MGTKKCPYCGEEIKAEAVLCRSCKGKVDNAEAAALLKARQAEADERKYNEAKELLASADDEKDHFEAANLYIKAAEMFDSIKDTDDCDGLI